MPAVGVLTLLSKWQADVGNIEAEVISQIVDMLVKMVVINLN